MQSSDNTNDDDKPVTKVLVSILVSNFPKEYTRQDLIDLFDNEDIPLGIELLPGNKAELVVTSVVGAFFIIDQCFYVKGREIIKQPFFQLAQKMENTVTFTPQNTVEFVIKTKLLNMDTLVAYMDWKKPKGSTYRIKQRKLDHLFTKIIFFFKPEVDLSLVRLKLGFKGQFYSIPYANIDFSQGKLNPKAAHAMTFMRTAMYRVEVLYYEKKRQERFQGSAIEFIDSGEHQCCIKQETKKCSYLNLKKKVKALDFFGEEQTEQFFNHCGIVPRVRKASMSEIWDREPQLKIDSSSFVEPEALKMSGKGPMQLAYSLLDAKPKFKKSLTNTSSSSNSKPVDNPWPLKPNLKPPLNTNEEEEGKGAEADESPEKLLSREKQQENFEKLKKDIKKKNVEKVSNRLGENIDFKDLTPEEVKEVKQKLKRIRRRERQRRKNLERLQQQEQEQKNKEKKG